MLPSGGVSYTWDGESAASGHDVNLDGVTDEKDAQAILDLLTGAIDDYDLDYDAGDLDGDNRRDLNSHRIIEIVQEDGVTKYLTKGDGNQFADATPVEADNIICRWDEGKSPRIKGLGKVLNFLQQPTGFLVAIVLPLVLFFLFELIMFIRKFVQLKNADKRQITAEDEELIRQKAIEEYIRSQQGEAPKPEAPAPVEEAPVAEAPAEQAAEAPAEEPAEEAAEEAAEAPVEEPAEEAAEESAEEPAE